jgi:hypothetical protein
MDCHMNIQEGGQWSYATDYSSVRSRPAGFVTFTPSTLALQTQYIMSMAKKSDRNIVPFKDDDAVPAAHVVSYLGSKALVVHEKEVHFPNIIDYNFFQTVRKKMACLGLRVNGQHGVTEL